MILGWLFFGDIPRAAMLLGAVLIVGSGLALSLRARTPPAATAPLPDKTG